MIQLFMLLAMHNKQATASNATKYVQQKLTRDGSQLQQQQQNAGGSSSSASASHAFDNLDWASAEIVLFEKLGTGGSSAIVYRCTVDGLTCAVKILDIEEQNSRTIDGFVREITMLERLSHPSIVRYLGHDVSLNKVRLFMEYYPWSLSKLLRKRRGMLLPVREVIKVAQLIVEGISYLHSQDPPIIHRDLKVRKVFALVLVFHC